VLVEQIAPLSKGLNSKAFRTPEWRTWAEEASAAIRRA
jgi:hypothetical protein